jgi:hypothetical protein
MVKYFFPVGMVQGGSNMTGTDLCVNLYKSVPVIFEPPCIMVNHQCVLYIGWSRYTEVEAVLWSGEYREDDSP